MYTNKFATAISYLVIFFFICVSTCILVFGNDCLTSKKKAKTLNVTYNKNLVHINEKLSTDHKIIYGATAKYPLNFDQNFFVSQGIINDQKYYFVPIINAQNKAQNIKILFKRTQISYSSNNKGLLSVTYKRPQNIDKTDPSLGYSFNLILPKGYVIEDKTQQDNSTLFLIPYLFNYINNSQDLSKDNTDIEDDYDISSFSNGDKTVTDTSNTNITPIPNQSKLDMDKSSVQEEDEENPSSAITDEEDSSNPTEGEDTGSSTVEEDTTSATTDAGED